MTASEFSELNGHQQAALLSFLKALAEGEAQAEQVRCRLCKMSTFEPHEIFKALQGDRVGQKGWICAYDVHPWLAAQHHVLSSSSLEDVNTILTPFGNRLGEVRFEGFMRLVLPKDPANAWLKDTALSRGPQPILATAVGDGNNISGEAALGLCELFKAECDLHRHLRYHRDNLRALGVRNDQVMRFMDAEQGVCAGMGGLIAPRAVRHLLVDTLQALSGQQCDAFLRRINPRGACLVSFEELVKYLSSPVHKLSRSPSHDYNALSAPAHMGAVRNSGCSNGYSSPPRSPSASCGAYGAPYSSPSPIVPQLPSSWREHTPPPARPSARMWSPAQLHGGSPESAPSPGHSTIRSAHHVSWEDSPSTLKLPIGKGSPEPWGSQADDLDTTMASTRDGREGLSPSSPRERWGWARSPGPASPKITSYPANRWLQEQSLELNGNSPYKSGYMQHNTPRRGSSMPPGSGGASGWASREHTPLESPTSRWGSAMLGHADVRGSHTSLADLARAKYDPSAAAAKREDFARATLQVMLSQANVDFRSPSAGEDLERERRKLISMPGYNFFSFDDVFHRISNGKAAFSLQDLRVAFAKNGIFISDHELALLFHRYAPHGEVTFPDFLRQVKPRFA